MISVPTLGKEGLDSGPWPQPLSFPTLAFILLMFPTSSAYSSVGWSHRLHYSNLEGGNRHRTDNLLLLLLLLTEKVPDNWTVLPNPCWGKGGQARLYRWSGVRSPTFLPPQTAEVAPKAEASGGQACKHR